jgi:AbiJ-like protein
MKFSERLGIISVRSALQARSLDEATRSRLWSAVSQTVPVSGGQLRFTRTWMGGLYIEIWSDFFKEPVDEMPQSEADVRSRLKQVVIDGQWYEVYDLLEFMIKSIGSHNSSNNLSDKIERILNEEFAGFRLMHGQFIEINNETEIRAIEESLSTTTIDRFAAVHRHLTEALKLLSDRRDPNYRNSIKESISAVEAVVQILTGNPNAELGKALKLLQPDLHGALLSAFTKLYGYTSDADGIRHALTEESNLEAADAKFMLVACSGFVSYLIQKAENL